MVILQAISWDARDEGNKYLVSIFGRTENGDSVCVTTPFQPYFFLKVKNSRAKSGVIEEFEERFCNDTDLWSKMIKKVELVQSKDLMGFQNSAKHVFMKLTFNTQANMKKAETFAHKKFRNCVYEANIEPFLRLMHRTGIKSTGWFEAEGSEDRGRSKCATNLWVQKWTDLKVIDRDDIAPFKICSVDIETYSSTGKFPNPLEIDDCIFQIAFTTKLYGRPEIVDKVCMCYKETRGENVEWYNSEEKLLDAFVDRLIEVDPDVITGYNIFGFDLEYIWKRCEYRGVEKRVRMGRLNGSECNFVAKRLSSGALGDNLLKMIPMSGRYIFDLFHEIKREKKLDSYSLNNVSKLFLGDTKIDMSANEMFRRYRDEDPVELGEVAEYCLKDTLLPHRLIDKLCVFTNLVEMAKATWVPLSYLSERAQQIKVFSQITRKARELGFKVPTIKRPFGKRDDDDDKYEGATVLEADVDAYYTPVTALDFASLYPSIMMAHNLCFSTLVLDSRYNNIDGVEYEKFTIKETSKCIHCRGMGCEICENTGTTTGDKDYYFAQGVPSLLPVILDELKQFRKKAKKLMAKARGTHMEEVYNGQQLAYKISMNSIYGFCGAKKGMLPCVPIAASVTCQGRRMIAMTKECVEANFEGAKVRYGDTDSVMVEFPCPNMSQEEAIRHSWKLGEEAAEMCNKLFKKPNDLELEKVYCPYILYSKKRYAAKMWTQNKAGEMEMEKIDVKGLQLVRRDNTPYTREVSAEVLEKILESNDPSEAITLAKKRAQELLDGKVPMEKLVMSKSLAESYKVKPFCSGCATLLEKGDTKCRTPKCRENPRTPPIWTDWKYNRMMSEIPQVIPAQPHVHVIEKMNIRNPGSHPHTGDRVPFVVIKHEDPKAKMFQKAEDPKAVTPDQLDYVHYFTNQLKKPIEDLLEPLIKGENIFSELMPPKIRKPRSNKKQTTLLDLFKDYEQNNSKEE